MSTAMNQDWISDLPPVPTIDAYIATLVNLRDEISAGQLAMLTAQYQAVEHTITATQLAQAAGYRNWRGANLQYGRLGFRFCEALSYDYQARYTIPSYILSYFIPPDGIDEREWLLIMQPNLVEALRRLRWFPARTTTPETALTPAANNDAQVEAAITPQRVILLEREFEDQVIVPLLKSWGLPYRRESYLRMRGRGRSYDGRIDFLVHTRDNATLLTLFENKRRITTPRELALAAQRANEYARARRLRSFVIAAPEGMWVYRRPGGNFEIAGQYSPEDLTQGALEALELLQQIAQR